MSIKCPLLKYTNPRKKTMPVWNQYSFHQPSQGEKPNEDQTKKTKGNYLIQNDAGRDSIEWNLFNSFLFA